MAPVKNSVPTPHLTIVPLLWSQRLVAKPYNAVSPFHPQRPHQRHRSPPPIRPRSHHLQHDGVVGSIFIDSFARALEILKQYEERVFRSVISI